MNKKLLDWCLEKGRSDKRKHRGLRIIEKNIEESKDYLKKAEHNLLFAERVRELKDFDDWIFPICFYSMYHACLAALSFFGYESRNQECTFLVMEKLIEEGKLNLSIQDIESIRKMGKSVENDMKTLREEFQYGTKVKAEKDLVDNTIRTANDFVKKVKGLLLSLFGEI